MYWFKNVDLNRHVVSDDLETAVWISACQHKETKYLPMLEQWDIFNEKILKQLQLLSKRRFIV